MTEGRARRIARNVIIGGVVVVAAMWVYVLFIASPENIDKLNDGSFAAAAEPICKQTVDELNTLGLVNQKASSPQERGTLAARADAELTKMVAALRTIPVTNADDAHAITGWLADWDQWLTDRSAWTAQLQQGIDAQFLEKVRTSTGQPNSKALNDFALVNSMRSCQTPGGI
jgi:hypothetical protein